MDRAMRMVFAGGLTLLLCGIAFLVYLGYLNAHPPVAQAKQAPTSMSGPPLEIPAFSLVDQDSKPRDRSVLEGRVSIVWFMFSNCPLACPAMTLQMSEMQRTLKNSGVQFVAFSIDPAHDTPQVLKAYGDKFSVDWSNWVYLTEPAGQPPKGIGRSIYANDLKQFVEEDAKNPINLVSGDGTMASIEHAVNFFLVGPDGRVVERGWFNAKHAEEMDNLRERAVGAVTYYREQGKLKQ